MLFFFVVIFNIVRLFLQVFVPSDDFPMIAKKHWELRNGKLQNLFQGLKQYELSYMKRT
ncbi:hypothetical protein M758_11G043100 [Ceratodon purpureus]|uniref:Uncharacterized protein n=1 Tax=Ceratodon purpureus TaxID=3225 RepID=A0A8T0GES5_CERPU|nr:hypothetical protein KC19_11G044700 [Ceratodon purpureus]KAG0600558.1 hypothetical protein M758_11G043100 [Ceratodon purpureus]